MISKKCKDAIMALVHIANNEQDDRAVMTSDIAREQQIPRKFLEIILRELRNNRILESKRGKDGGFRLLGDAEESRRAEGRRLISGRNGMRQCVAVNECRKGDEGEE